MPEASDARKRRNGGSIVFNTSAVKTLLNLLTSLRGKLTSLRGRLSRAKVVVRRVSTRVGFESGEVRNGISVYAARAREERYYSQTNEGEGERKVCNTNPR
jgi:hypothetical protein